MKEEHKNSADSVIAFQDTVRSTRPALAKLDREEHVRGARLIQVKYGHTIPPYAVEQDFGTDTLTL